MVCGVAINTSPSEKNTRNEPYSLLKEIVHPQEHKITSISFSIYHLAIGDENGIVLIYDISSWKQIPTTIPLDLKSKIRILKFSPCCRYLGIGCDYGTIMIIDFKDMENSPKVSINSRNCSVIERNAIIHALAFRPIMITKNNVNQETSCELALGGFDGIVGIANMRRKKVKKEVSRLGVILSLDYSPCGEFLAIGASDKCVTIIDSNSLQVLLELKRFNSVQCVQWSQAQMIEDVDDDFYFYYLAAGGRDGIVAIYSVPTDLYEKNKSKLIKEIFPSKKSTRVLCLGWNLENSYFASAGTDEVTSVYDLNEEEFTLKQEIGRQVSTQVTCLAFHEHFLAVGGKDSRIFVYKNVQNSTKHKRRVSDSSILEQSIADVDSTSNEGKRLSRISARRRSSTRDSFLSKTSFDDDNLNLLPISSCFSMVPRSWGRHKFSQPLVFLHKSDEFLEHDEISTAITSTSFTSESNASSNIALTTFATSLRMLRSYLQRLRKLEDEKNNLALTLSDDFTFLSVLCNDILATSIKIMDDIVQQQVDAEESFEMRFAITLKKEDIKLIKKWNLRWREQKDLIDVPYLDLNLLLSFEKDSVDGRASDTSSVSASVGSTDTVEENILSFRKPDHIITSSDEHEKFMSRKGKPSRSTVKKRESEIYLRTCENFLKRYESGSPPSHLRSFISVILMLQCHVQFVQKKEDDKLVSSRIKKNTKSLEIYILLLKIFTCAMENEVANSSETLCAILKLNLCNQDFKLLQEWNNLFKNDDEENSYLPLVDHSLIELVLDDLKDEQGEESTSDTSDIRHSFILSMKEKNGERKIKTIEEEEEAGLSSLKHKSEKKQRKELDRADEFFRGLLWSQANFQPAVTHKSKERISSPALGIPADFVSKARQHLEQQKTVQNTRRGSTLTKVIDRSQQEEQGEESEARDSFMKKLQNSLLHEAEHEEKHQRKLQRRKSSHVLTRRRSVKQEEKNPPALSYVPSRMFNLINNNMTKDANKSSRNLSRRGSAVITNHRRSSTLARAISSQQLMQQQKSRRSSSYATEKSTQSKPSSSEIHCRRQSVSGSSFKENKSKQTSSKKEEEIKPLLIVSHLPNQPLPINADQ